MDTRQADDPSGPTSTAARLPDFQTLFESSPGAYLVLSPTFTIVAVTDAYLRATMTRREQIVGRGIFDVFPDNPDDPAATGVRNLSESLARVARDRVADAMAVQKYPIRRPEQEGGGFELRYWSPVNFPVTGPDGDLAWLIHRVEDVTEFIQLKQRGTEQEQLTRELRSRGEKMETEIFKRAQEIQQVNRRLREAEVLLKQRVEERTADLATANKALQAEISQTKELEAQLRHAQKMEAVGTLAGGVAHDFNNLLTVIAGYTDMLLDGLPANDSVRRLVEPIQTAGNRATSLTRQLLAFSRRQVLEPKVLDLNDIVAETDRMLHRLIGEDISLTCVLRPNLGHVRTDPGQLQQVIMNLAINARDAMPQGGQLTIETDNVDLDGAYAQMHVNVKPGRYVMLAMSDTGCGMDDKTRARIFEPFFTTKAPGKGTGLGLATVFGIVQQSGGHIWVYSEPGSGATFKIYLPLSDADLTPRKSAAQRAARPGTETVLLVEDDDAVRAMTVLALRAFGYLVLEASHGREAIRLCKEHAGPIHLLISDVVMPGMGGRNVAAAILALRPEVRVLFLSGYTDDAVVRHGILHEEVAFLQKPFTPDSLAMKVRDVLE